MDGGLLCAPTPGPIFTVLAIGLGVPGLRAGARRGGDALVAEPDVEVADAGAAADPGGGGQMLKRGEVGGEIVSAREAGVEACLGEPGGSVPGVGAVAAAMVRARPASQRLVSCSSWPAPRHPAMSSAEGA